MPPWHGGGREFKSHPVHHSHFVDVSSQNRKEISIQNIVQGGCVLVGQRMSRISRKRVAMIGILVLVLVSSTMILLDVFPPFYEQSHEMPLPGVPVQNTPFAGLISDTADSVFLPAGPVVSTNNGVKMTIVEKINEPVISQEEAEQIGIDYFSQFPYMSNVTLEPDPFWNELRDNPYYSLRYSVGQYEFYAGVNAMTGRVIAISPHWSVLMQYNTSTDSSILSLEAIEDKACNFLERNNYTLSSNARVEGPTLEQDTILHNFPAYRLRFFCAINGCLIRRNGLSMLLSIKSGVVISFFYHWRNVTQIPVENVVSAIQAERTAKSYLRETLQAVDFDITSSSLEFYVIDSYPIVTFQLCWVIDISHEQYGTIVIDAIDLEVLCIFQYGWTDELAPCH